MTTQQLIQEQVEIMIDGLGQRLVTEKEWANRGYWAVYTVDELAFVGKISFDFQHAYFALDCEGWHRRFTAQTLSDAVGAVYEFFTAEV